MSRPTLALAATLALTVALTPVAPAGVADTPLPVLVPGQTTQLLYTVPGVIMGGESLGSFFFCTSTDTAAIQVGVELFSSVGGAPANDAVASSLSVFPGGTVRFGTISPAGFTVGSVLGGFGYGSARILATSKKLLCTAFVADLFGNPPQTSWQLTVIAKTKQKAAN